MSTCTEHDLVGRIHTSCNVVPLVWGSLKFTPIIVGRLVPSLVPRTVQKIGEIGMGTRLTCSQPPLLQNLNIVNLKAERAWYLSHMSDDKKPRSLKKTMCERSSQQQLKK